MVYNFKDLYLINHSHKLTIHYLNINEKTVEFINKILLIKLHETFEKWTEFKERLRIPFKEETVLTLILQISNRSFS